jgi:cytosine deaminase
MTPDADIRFLDEAIVEAMRSLEEGGIPIGAVLVREGRIVGRGHNRRIQRNSPILHAEIDCLANAGREVPFRDATLYTSLAPCYLCSGAVVQFGISRVVVADSTNFEGAESFLRSHDVEVRVLQVQKAVTMLTTYIDQHRDIWLEDIGKQKG